MKVVHKQRLQLGVGTVVPGRLVHFAMQGDDPAVWFLRTEPETEREVLVVGTGWTFNDSWMPFMSTVDGPFVWHLLYRDTPRKDQP